MSAQVSGTEGYADEAKALFTRYESIPAANAHRTVLHLIPSAPSRIHRFRNRARCGVGLSQGPAVARLLAFLLILGNAPAPAEDSGPY
jgi:hypothetical protein